MALQHATPLIIDDLERPQKIVRLDRIRRSLKPGGGPRFVEGLLQRLVHDHPSSLPVEEIEPVFKHLRSVCQELKLRIDGTERYVDNLLINPDGRICLVECKLWHNPESVREVIGQILDYTAAVAALSYDGLREAVRRSLPPTEDDPLIRQVLGPDVSEEEREAFIDNVARSLRLGNFLLLIVGDGIRSGVQQIARILRNSTLGFSFGLVEIAIFGNPGGGGPYYVQPRILARTELIERTVFIAETAPGSPKVLKVDAGGPAQSISEKEFFDQLAQVNPDYPDDLRSFFDRCRLIGCDTQLRKQYSLYVDSPAGGRLNLGSVRKDGFVEVWGGVSRQDGELGEPIGRRYMERLVAFLSDARIKDDTADPGYWKIRQHGRVGIRLDELLRHRDAWFEAIQELVDRLRQIEQSQDSRAP